jgi:DNA-3-methyladenine glycosylase I
MNFEKNNRPVSQMVAEVESYLRAHSIAGAYDHWLERYSVSVSDRDDRFLFEKLIQAIFSGGMSGAVVDAKMPSMGAIFDSWDATKIAEYPPELLEKKILAHGVIKHKGKLSAMVANAREVCQLREKFGSFGKYLTSSDFEKLVIDLQRRFDFLGPVTVHDFLRNIGFDTIKPDRHILRWLSRIGMLSVGTSENEAISVAKEVAQEVGISLAQLDSIIYLFCASRGDVISEPLCGDQPKCTKCPIIQFCDRILDDDLAHDSATPLRPGYKSREPHQKGIQDIMSHKRYTRGSNMILSDFYPNTVVENEDKARKLFNRIKDKEVLQFLNALMNSLNEKIERCYAVTHEFKYVVPRGRRCSFYIRPSAGKMDIYLETFSPSDIHNKNKLKNLPLEVRENTSNPKDQFKSLIEVNKEWLTEHRDKTKDLLEFINGLIDDLADYYV